MGLLTGGGKKAALAGAGLLGMGSNEAEAKVPVRAILNRLIQIGFMDPKYASDPTQIKRATTAYEKQMANNPAFKARETKALMGGHSDDYERLDLGDRHIIKPEELQGKALASVMGDRSDIGSVKKVGGIELPEPVHVEGGADFSQRWKDDGIGWASEYSIAKKKQDALRNAGKDSGRDVVGVYSAMGPDSINYSTPIAEMMMAQIPRSKKLRVRDKKAFDSELRKEYPQWVGLDSPNAMNQLMGRAVDGVPALPGKARTSFSTIMGKADYRNKGFPTYKDAVDVATNPALKDVGIGDSGYTMFKARPDEDVTMFGGHQTYNAKIPGDYVGGLAESVPSEIMFPDAFAQQSARVNAAGKPFTRGQAMNAIGTRGDVYQVADQKWVDGVSNHLKDKGLLSAAPMAVGAGMLAGGEDAQAGTLKSPERPDIGFGDLVGGLASGVGAAMIDAIQYTPQSQALGLLGLGPETDKVSEGLLNMGKDYEGKKLLQFMGGLLSPL